MQGTAHTKYLYDLLLNNIVLTALSYIPRAPEEDLVAYCVQHLLAIPDLKVIDLARHIEQAIDAHDNNGRT